MPVRAAAIAGATPAIAAIDSAVSSRRPMC